MNIKRRTKTQKGITLIALIITIVILLILALVSITTISKEELFQQAEESTIKYNQTVKQEQDTIGEYGDILKNYFVSSENGEGNGENTIKVKEGDTVQYDSNNDETTEDWIVLTAREGLVEIVSAQPMGSLKLGHGDTSVSVTTDLDGDGIAGSDLDKAIASYNNAITTINNYCKSLVTATDNEGVRSVGASIEQDTSGDYSSTNFNKWFKNSSTVKVKAGDEYHATDFDKMEELGILEANENYWIASRSVFESTVTGISFGVDRISTDGDMFGETWRVDTSGKVHCANSKLAVRPVIKNPSGI